MRLWRIFHYYFCLGLVFGLCAFMLSCNNGRLGLKDRRSGENPDGKVNGLSEDEQRGRAMTANGYPATAGSSDHPAFHAFSNMLSAFFPLAHAEQMPPNPDRKVYTSIVPSTWGGGHYMECTFKNVSSDLSTPGVNAIDATAVLQVTVKAESGQNRTAWHHVFPQGAYTTYEKVLNPGDTLMLLWGGASGPPQEPGNATNPPQVFPRGFLTIVRNLDPMRRGLLQGKCSHWWSNGGYNYDIPIFGGFPF